MRLFLFFLFLLSTSSAHRSTRKLQDVVESPIEMVVTNHPLATEAGQKVLGAGGTAVDAMVAVQTVLTLVEPQSSGLGGGAFCVYWDGKKLTTFDARETAPFQATEERFINDSGEPLGFFAASQSVLSVGVPGVVKLMQTMHGKYGRQSWESLLEPAQMLAKEGFEMSELLSNMINRLLSYNPSCEQRFLLHEPEVFDYLVDVNPEDGTCAAKPAGTLMKNPDYATTLEALAEDGAGIFYEEESSVVQAIVSKLETAFNPSNDASLTSQDFANYQVKERDAVCQTYREFNICGMGPPSSGGLAVGQIFGILDHIFEELGDGPQAVSTIHLFLQAVRLAFADRNKYVGDSDFVLVPVEGMLDKDYLSERADDLINLAIDMGIADAGTPPGVVDPASPQMDSNEGGTSHISIVDQYGNALSMTSSIEMPFGSGYMVGGFFLNNQLTDFSFIPTGTDGIPIANRVEGGKRPRSSMSPTIVFRDRKVSHLVGSPGGWRIINFVAKTLLSMVEYGLDPHEAIHVPHAVNDNGAAVEVEEPVENVTSSAYSYDNLVEGLTAKNYTIKSIGGPSGLGAIQILDDGTLLGGADLRRQGTASGRTVTDDRSKKGGKKKSKVGKKSKKQANKSKKSKKSN